jgi:WD40 repeat protein
MNKFVTALVLVVGLVITEGAVGLARGGEPAPVCVLEGLKDEKLVSFAPGGKAVLVTTKEDTIKLWDTQKGGKPVTELRHEELKGLQDVLVSFTASKSLIAASYTNGGTVVWDVSTPKGSFKRVAIDPVTPLGVFPGGKLMFSENWDVGRNNIVRVLDMAAPERKPATYGFTEPRDVPANLKNSGGFLRTNFEYENPVVFSADHKWAALPWRVNLGAKKFQFVDLMSVADDGPRHEDNLFLTGGEESPAIGFAEDHLVVLRNYGRLTKYNITKRMELQEQTTADVWEAKDQMNAPSWVAPDGKSILAIWQLEGDKYKAIRWNLELAKIGQTEPAESDLKGSPQFMMAPDGSTFAMTARDGKLKVYKGPGSLRGAGMP